MSVARSLIAILALFIALPVASFADAAPEVVITGMVTDEVTGQALRGATLCYGTDGASVRADENGRFVLSGLATGPCPLRVFKAGYQVLEISGLVLETGEHREVRVSLVPRSASGASGVMVLEKVTVTAEETAASDRDDVAALHRAARANTAVEAKRG